MYHLLHLGLLPAQALAVHLRHQWIPRALKVKGGKATKRVLGLAVFSLELRLLHQQHRLLSTNINNNKDFPSPRSMLHHL
jgi:hypothetical protein